MKKRKTALRMLVALALLAFVSLNVLARRHVRTMSRFVDAGTRTQPPEELSLGQKLGVLLSGVEIPRPQSAMSPTELDPATRVVEIRVSENISLEAWYVDRGADTPLVALFHGYAAEKSSLVPAATAFLELGASVLLVDFRGSGGSSESHTSFGIEEAEDVAAVVRFVGDELSHRRLDLFGQSMGSVAILRAVAVHGVEADGLMIESVFDTLRNTVRNRFRAMGVPAFPNADLLVFWGGREWGVNAFRHNPADYAASVQIPILFFHGADDPRATLEEARRVYDAVPGRKYFITFENTGHESLVIRNPEAWREAVRKFWDHSLRTPHSEIRTPQFPRDFRGHAGVVGQQGAVGGEAFAAGAFRDPGEEKRRDRLAGDSTRVGFREGGGQGGFEFDRFQRAPGGAGDAHEDGRAQAERVAMANDVGRFLRGIDAPVHGQT